MMYCCNKEVIVGGGEDDDDDDDVIVILFEVRDSSALALLPPMKYEYPNIAIIARGVNKGEVL